MQKIVGDTILINRGDEFSILLTIKNSDDTDYTFQEGDKITFSIYNKGKMSENALLIKEVNAIANMTTLEINLTSEEMKIGELINKPKDYWYEIELNNNYTVLGYDEDGAKIITLFPEGSQIQ